MEPFESIPLPRWTRLCPEAKMRKGERGQTVLLVAASMVALMGMAALAIDVSSLYLAKSEAEKVAAAAALAGAKAFVSTGFTSGGLGNPASAESLVCNGSTGFADLQAKAAASKNSIGGTPPTTVTTSCAFPTPENPRITVSVQRTGLPSFFGRIWGRLGNQVGATATAEAFNPSGGNVPIDVTSVKPWLIPNCDYAHAGSGTTNPNCPPALGGGLSAAYYLDATRNYAINNNGIFIGTTIFLNQILLPLPLLSPLVDSYYTVDVPISSQTVSCPAAAATSCSAVQPSTPGYFERVACANSTPLKCGDTVPVSISGGLLLSPPNNDAALMCLVHANGYGATTGQDAFNISGIPNPTRIDGGSNNPNPVFRTATNISRSDSVVTVPMWDAASLCTPGVLCPAKPITGFMQLGIIRIDPIPLSSGRIEAVILNVSGCGNATGTAISGGGLSPIPVRLVQ